MHDTGFAASDVLDFWLGACPLQEPAMRQVQAQWFTKSEVLDAEIGQRFGSVTAAALAGKLEHWAIEPLGWLALLIVLDQFPRNVWRGMPASFSGDHMALTLATKGLEAGFDKSLPAMARIFAYLPFEHAEDARMQARSVALFEQLHQSAAPDSQAFFAGTLDYARRHQSVIAQFGRFPHRNAILGRSSTPEEQAYLTLPGSGF